MGGGMVQLTGSAMLVMSIMRGKIQLYIMASTLSQVVCQFDFYEQGEVKVIFCSHRTEWSVT